MNWELADHPQGTVLAVWVVPGARRPGMHGAHGGALKVAVAQPAEKGRANEALLELLAHLLDVAPRQVVLLSGVAARRKRVLIRDIGREQLVERLATALKAAGGKG
jgi:uncharacterized protein (TIGR00251 family)